MENRLSTGLSGKMEQQQVLSQNMQRSLELLAMPVAILEERLTAELIANPMLEEISATPEAELPVSSGQETEDENDYENNSILPDHWSDDLPLPGDNSEAAERDYLGTLPAPPPPLRTLLMTELMSMPLSEEQQHIALEIISALKDDGYLGISLPDLAMICDADMDEVNKALALVQNIAPAGVAARDLPECLKLQLARKGKLTAELEKLLDEGLEDLEKNRISALEKKLGISNDQLDNMLKTLRTLNPAPGRENNSFTAAVTPDLTITMLDNGNYTAVVRKENSMRIIVSPLYEKLLGNGNLSSADRNYLQEKLAHAKELISAVNMRESTLKRLGEIIIKYQKDFLDHGIDHLHGLTMKTAATELGLNESTVSRAVAEKFVETPQGSFPLKYFFSGSYNTGDGNDIATQAVLKKIRNIVSAEDPSAPLSDEAIAKILKNEGLSVARRTIAKYRKLLKIPSSTLRKKFF